MEVSPVRVRRDYGDKNCIGRNVVSLRKEKNIKQKILLFQKKKKTQYLKKIRRKIKCIAK